MEYNFRDPSLLKQALSHPSLASRGLHRSETYERLEFLGNSILGLVIADLLFKTHQNVNEGMLSIMHSNLVSTKIVAQVAMDIKLDESLLLDIGEEKNGGRTNLRNLENAMEALVAAIYLDSSFDTAKGLITQLWSKYLSLSAEISKKNYKSLLQEHVQKRFGILPQYNIVETKGADHAPIFKVMVTVANIGSVIGEGKSKKEAEINAAQTILSEYFQGV
ncbi:ribonuclease III [Rickettsiales endosymbiont of Peranema trichophorum]|uniref:ribonuclease III n=1 Tax=Rickettsiales endosymbiont of Peranema trichophorum TaxID=2486577 RepID=UPI001A924C1E|nr:ribonuclease III [Rickettsiales endosymbiont of Peranema trichophorum]